MGWRELKHEETYSDAEMEARLEEELPHWYVEKAGYGVNTRPAAGKGC